MKVLFDSQIFDIQKFGGASRCFCELIKSFPSDIIAQISIMINCNIHLRNECLCFKAWGGNTGLVSVMIRGSRRPAYGLIHLLLLETT